MKIFDERIIVQNISGIVYFLSKETAQSPISYNANLRHNELIIRLTGKTVNHFANQTVEINPNTVVMMPKRDLGLYQVDVIEKGACIDIFFDTEQPLCDKVYTFDCSKNQRICELFERCLSVWEQKQDGYFHKCLSMLYEILTKLQPKDYQYVDERKRARIKLGQEYILSHFADSRIDYYYPAQISRISYTYFKKIFSSIHGMPPVEYVKKLRMEKASDLIQTGLFSVGEIARQCGYDDISYFSKLFKKYYGISPKHYSITLHQ